MDYLLLKKLRKEYHLMMMYMPSEYFDMYKKGMQYAIKLCEKWIDDKY